MRISDPTAASPAVASDEAGFTILEAAIAVAILTIAIGGMLSAMLAILAPLADARWNTRLTTVAQNVLTDLRASSAYDPSVLTPMIGQSTTVAVPAPDATGPGAQLSVTVDYARPIANGPVHAIVIVADARQHVVRFDNVLPQEAPAPGAVLTPAPSLVTTTPMPVAVATPQIIYLTTPPPIVVPTGAAEGSGGG